MDPTIKDFESAVAELETIVKKLEDGDLALEKSLELFERGVQLSRFCHSKLEEAERRIEILNERGEIESRAGGARPDDDSDKRGDAPSSDRRATWLDARRQDVDAALERYAARRAPACRTRDRRRRDALQPHRRRQAAAAAAGAGRGGSGGRAARPARADAARRWRCRRPARSSSSTPTRSSTTTCPRWTTTRCAAAGRRLTSSSARGWRSSPATALLTEAFSLLAREPAQSTGVDATSCAAASSTRSRSSPKRPAPPAWSAGRRSICSRPLPAPTPLDGDGLRAMHARKTGALILASALAGAVMGGATADADRRRSSATRPGRPGVSDRRRHPRRRRRVGRPRQDRRQGRGGRQADLPVALRPRRSRRLAAECVDARASPRSTSAGLAGQLPAIARLGRRAASN